MKNILYIVDSDATKCTFGSEQRANLLYKALQNIANVYVIQTSDRDEQVNSKYWRLRISNQTGIKRILNSIWIRFICLLCSYPRCPYLLFPLRMDVNQAYPNVKFDAVVVRYLSNVNALHLWNMGPLYVDVDDHPLQVFETSFGWRISAFQRMLGRVIHQFFVWLPLRKAAGVWVSNPEQLHLVSNFKNAAVLRNIPCEVRNSCSRTAVDARYLFTVGLMSYPPNYEGVDAFICEIWPKVRKLHPNMIYVVVGKGVPGYLAKKWSSTDGVRLAGFVEDLDSMYSDALATVVPIISGGGTCIKTLESLAKGRVCFSTKFGARGIPLHEITKKDLGLLVYTSADDFLRLLDNVVSNYTWRWKVEENSISYINEKYSYASFMAEVANVMSDI